MKNIDEALLLLGKLGINVDPPDYPAIFKLSFDSTNSEVVRIATFIRKEFLWGDGHHPEKEFILVHAQFARRRSDGMEVEFLNRHEVRYHGAAGDYVLNRESVVDKKGIPKGSAVDLPRDISEKDKTILIADMNDASATLRTAFFFD